MSTWINIFWWLCFTIVAICIQSLSSGLDVFVVGLIILLQEDDYRNMLWLLPLFVFLQEGMGTRPFGAMIIWYATIIILFKIGRCIFDTNSFIFVFVLSACIGVVYFALVWLMAPLQDLIFNFEQTWDKSLIQAIFIPFVWKLFTILRPSKQTSYEE